MSGVLPYEQRAILMGGGAVVFDEASKRRLLGSDVRRAMTRLWAQRAFMRPGLTPHMQASKQRRHEAASAMHLLCKLVACCLQSALYWGPETERARTLCRLCLHTSSPVCADLLALLHRSAQVAHCRLAKWQKALPLMSDLIMIRSR